MHKCAVEHNVAMFSELSLAVRVGMSAATV